MVRRLILILGDQLSEDVAALRMADPEHDVIVMAEVTEEAGYVPHHPKKIALVLSAMRHFAQDLRAKGYHVAYTRMDDPAASKSIVGELMRRYQEFSATDVIATCPGEWRLIEALEDAPLNVRVLPDDRFIATRSEFETWAEGRKELRMEWFYRDMRRKTGLLMDGDAPEGGKWNYDKENRKTAPNDLTRTDTMRFEPDAITQDVLDLVEEEFGSNFGVLRPFQFAVTRIEALQALEHFVVHLLPRFGDYQDAMLQNDAFLHHSILSSYLNIGLLGPLEICERVAESYYAGAAPLNAVEGFVRQIIGWREYMRGIYFIEGSQYAKRNSLRHDRALPAVFWGSETRMNCMSHAVGQTRQEGYAHHIQRLMVTGNFALLAGIDPREVHEWYLAVYVDAFEWVEAPNTIGMSQFADDGIIASKPYVSSGNYINKMSDYCGDCSYAVKDKTGANACPFNVLYWHFLNRHRERFSTNHRMRNIYGAWDKMDKEKRDVILADADDFLGRMTRGEVV